MGNTEITVEEAMLPAVAVARVIAAAAAAGLTWAVVHLRRCAAAAVAAAAAGAHQQAAPPTEAASCAVPDLPPSSVEDTCPYPCLQGNRVVGPSCRAGACPYLLRV